MEPAVSGLVARPAIVVWVRRLTGWKNCAGSVPAPKFLNVVEGKNVVRLGYAGVVFRGDGFRVWVRVS